MTKTRFLKNIVPIFLVAVSTSTLVACSIDKSEKSQKGSGTKSTSTQPANNSNNEQSTTSTLKTDKNVGLFADYSKDLVSQAGANEKVILFFHAQWCPTCKSIEKNIKANLDEIPGGVRILLVDFDEESELKKKYDVRQQYTMVQVDNTGKKIDLWTDSYSLEDIITSTV